MNSILEGIDNGIVRQGPQTLHLDVTNGCNAACVTCWDHSPLLFTPRPAAWKARRAEVGAVEALLDDVAGLGGLRSVIVSGMGEPFTHPEIDRIVAAIKARGLHVTVITNLVAADAERILALEIDELLVGVHAATEASYRAFHPGFRGPEWDRLHGALARLRDAGRRFKHVQVICRTNAHEIVPMVELAARYRAGRITFKLASLGGGTEAVRIDEGQRASLLAEWIPAAAARAAALGVATNLDVLAFQLTAGGACTAPIEEVGCFMGYTYARVLVDGTVLYCCDAEAVVGSLSEARFSELWRGPAWQAWRARLRRGDYLPGCRRCGKLNQNVRIGRRFAAVHGEARRREVTGRTP